MVVETSAVLAILLDEPEAAEFAQLIEDDPAPVISGRVRVGSRDRPHQSGDGGDLMPGASNWRDFLAQGGLQVEPVTAEQADLALDAYQRYGKGRHRAGV